MKQLYIIFYIVFVRSFVLTKHEKSHVIREEMGTAERHIDIEYVDTDSVEVQEIDYQDEESVKQATDLLLQKELGEEIIEGQVEQEIIQDEQEFKVIEHHDIVSVEEHGMVSRGCWEDWLVTLPSPSTSSRWRRWWRPRRSPWPRLTVRS